MVIYASYLKRFIAGIIDGFISWFMQKIIKLFIQPAFLYKASVNLPTKALNQSFTEAYNAWIDLIFALIISLITISFFAYFISKKGYSPGKKLLNLTIQKESGGNLSFGKAVIREFGKILSILPLGLGFIWMFFDKRRQTWHDKLTDSLVLSSN